MFFSARAFVDVVVVAVAWCLIRAKKTMIVIANDCHRLSPWPFCSDYSRCGLPQEISSVVVSTNSVISAVPPISVFGLWW